MKRRGTVIAAAAILMAVAAALLWKTPEAPPVPKHTTSTPKADGMTLATNTDPILVFQKAFWRRPSGDDKILHAERHEWSAGKDVRKWQWFIAVSPGPQLLEWLKSNPFSLTKVESAGDFENRPEWFPKSSETFNIQRNAEGRFTMMLSADGKQLYATDSGFGFTAPDTAP